jgi:hypothetical protein
MSVLNEGNLQCGIGGRYDLTRLESRRWILRWLLENIYL